MKRAYSFRIAAVIAVYLCLFLSDAYADLVINSGETFVLNPANSEVISINGDLIITNNGNLQGGNNTEIRVNGDWDNSANGSFTHANAKVVFTGSDISIIKGNNQFHHLVINKKETDIEKKFTGTEIQIEAGTTQTISSQLFLNGAAIDDRLRIRSTINGVSHTLNAYSAIYVEAWFLDIDDSVFMGKIDMPTIIDSSSITVPIVGSGNNDGWIPNSPPTAEAGIAQTVVSSSTVTLDGSASSDIDNGDTRTFAWSQNSGPVVTLSSTTADKPTFTAPTLGANDSPVMLVFSLRVTDNKGLESVDDTVTITVNPPENSPPTAEAGIAQTVVSSSTVTLDGSASSDIDNGDTLTYAWTQSSGAAVTLSSTTADKPTFTAPTLGANEAPQILVFSLSVTDSKDLESAADTVSITVVPPSPRVTISETAEQNQTLSLVHNLSNSDNLGEILFQWLANDEEIVGMTQATFIPTQDQVGETVRVRVSYTNYQGEAKSVLSNSTAAVENVNDDPQGRVWITGIVGVDQILTANNDIFDADGLGEISYQWLADGVNIVNADDNTYQLSQIDINKTITVIARYTDAYGKPESKLSNNTSTKILNDALNQLAVDSENNSHDLYVAAGITGVSEANLNSINDAFKVTGVTTQIEIQQLVDSYNAILDFAENDLPGAMSPSVEDYTHIGVIGITQNSTVLSLLSDVIELGDAVDVDSVSKLQALTNAVLAVYDQAENETNELSKAQLELLGIEGVTESNLAPVKQIIADTDENIDKREKIQLLVNKIVASQVIQAYRINIVDNPEPSLINYQHLELTHINSDNIESINSAIVTLDPSALDSVENIVFTLTEDSDSDAVIDLIDSFPQDPNEFEDQDADRVGDNKDNCLNLANTNQLDMDADSVGDACDTDRDGDGKENNIDNCPNIANSNQLNIDGDTYGDSCDADIDNDGVANNSDNCPNLANSQQLDLDADSIGDLCDEDKDNDAVVNSNDNCPNIANPNQLNTDADTYGDICDADKDNDGVVNNSDNCPNIPNQLQLDFDSDSLGDACDPDEDGDGVVSADDAFKFNSNYSSDTDNDGMPDAFEEQYGFDVNNSLDKTTDSDGDGVINLDEFLAGTNPRINPNPGLPQLVIPNDIETISTGRMTAVDIGVATAIDGSQVQLQPVANFYGPFSAGRHEVTWVASDAAGNQSKAVQVIKVLPLVNLTPSSQIAEGGVIDISAVLSGDAADYPVEIPYMVSGSATKDLDYKIDQSDGIIRIDQGRKASFRVEVRTDDEPEDDETIKIQITEPTNAVLGSVTEQTILIVDGNLPPKITVMVEQGDNLGRVIASDKGEVTITASVTDPNPEDTHQFDWQLESKQTSAVVSETTQYHKKILVIDPSQLKPGVFSIAAKATDSADIVATTEVKTDFRLMEAAPDLSNEMDSDGDGVSDAEEGYADSDNDGIVDYMDNIVESNLAPISENSNSLIQGSEGTQLILGEMAFANAKNSVLVSKEKVIQIISEFELELSKDIDDKDYSYPIGLYDFTISGAIPGRSYYLVIPMSLALEEGQIFRKYMGSDIGWQNFIENAKNTLFSAKADDGACPEPASRLYDYGLQPGNNCIQIYIEDGGPNDADGKADGIVTDPAGIAVYIKPAETNNSVVGDDNQNTVEQDVEKPVEIDEENLDDPDDINEPIEEIDSPVEDNGNIQVGAPSSKLSKIMLSQSIIYTGGNTATIRVEAKAINGESIDNVDIHAQCIYCLGVNIGDFKQTGSGLFEAFITSGRQISLGYIDIELTNEFGKAKLEPQKLNVIYAPSGGCAVAVNSRSDISLFLMLILLTLYHRRKKHLI